MIRHALQNKSGQGTPYSKDTSVLANEFNTFFTSVGAKTAHDSEELARLHGLSKSSFPNNTTAP